MKKKMFPRPWKTKLVDLDLLERSVSFCPRFNMSAVRSRTRLSWDLFESRLLDQCVELGCESKYDLCCPYLLDGHNDQFKVSVGLFFRFFFDLFRMKVNKAGLPGYAAAPVA